MADLVGLLAELIRHDTHNPGGDEAALARRLADELAARGPDQVEVVDVDRARRGAYVYARWGAPRLLLNAHIDTVPPNAGWTGDPYAPRREGDRVVGLGACDTKGAIAAILAALDAARPRDLAVLFSGDEEHGGSCVRAFLRSPAAAGLERAIVCEPTGCRAGTRHRGILAFTVRLEGEGGHSSRADHLPAPVAELARLAVAVHDWGVARRDAGPPGFAGMRLNVAKLDGGVAFNVVPDAATLSFSLRPPPGADADGVRAELDALCRRIVPGATVEVPLAHPTFATRELAAFEPLLGDVARAPIDLGFWTEAAVLAAAGIDAVVFGPGDIAQAHAPDEFVTVAQLERARDLFVDVFDGSR